MRGMIGAVLAGGESRRFGSDKAVAIYQGKSLMDHAIDILRRVTPDIVICGRPWPGHVMVPDYPAAGLGPLGGLCGGLRHAQETGAAYVLTIGCDTPLVPPELIDRLIGIEGASFLEELPIIGHWPSDLAPELTTYLETQGDRSLRGWTRWVKAKPYKAGYPIPNINSLAELKELERPPGS